MTEDKKKDHNFRIETNFFPIFILFLFALIAGAINYILGIVAFVSISVVLLIVIFLEYNGVREKKA